ncbi:MAG TPA: radical SAM protein, partial [Lachnospiraceae bacterium]|nr:radical SAM protein [Lachnospiraceae bacterium]
MHCTLCPRDCHADRDNGKTGYCGESAALRVSRAALHYWEEPCISGKSGSGTIFFTGCPLKCIFCQNESIANGSIGKSISVDRLSEIFLELQDKGACNINLVTPTHFIPQIANALEKSKDHGLQIPIVYNTGGYEKAETLKFLSGLVDIYLPDLKYYSTK